MMMWTSEHEQDCDLIEQNFFFFFPSKLPITLSSTTEMKRTRRNGKETDQAEAVAPITNVRKGRKIN